MTAQIEDVLALTPLQEGLFALHRLADDHSDRYTMQLLVDIDGPVDLGLLRRSAEAMLDRHPNLRAAFWDRDVPRPVQIVPARTDLPWDERAALPTEFDDIATAERQLPFDLGRGPALRVVVLGVPGTTTRRLIFTAHHILMDGWALAVFFTEMLAVYRAGGSAAGLPPVRPYRDYVSWLARQDTAAALTRWTEYLGAAEPLMLAEPAGPDGVPEQTSLRLSAEDTVRLRNWAGRHGFTLNTAVLFAWTVVLSRLAGRRDVVFGTIVSGRPEQLTGIEGMVGLFINSVPVVHTVTRAASVIDQCARLQRETSAMRDIGYLSLSEIQRAHGRGPLFDSMFVFENAPLGDAVQTVTTPDGACFRPIEMASLTHYPLTVVAHLHDDELVVVIEAIPDALPHLPAPQIGDRLVAVLRRLPDAGDQPADALDVLSAAERADLAGLSARPTPDHTVWEAFERQVRATPDAPALSGGDGTRYSYAELHGAACRLAGELADHGVGPETVVALVLSRSPRSIVAILAVLAAGAGYLPVDATLPAARIESMLRQAGPLLAITESDHVDLVGAATPVLLPDDPGVAERIAGRPAHAPAVRRHPEHCAYVIFTSGSTGEPKGVIGTNAALLGYFVDHRDRVYRPARARLGRPLRIAHAWSFGFDASWQPMVGLLDGHALHLFDAEEMRDAGRLVAGVAAHRIDMIDTTPSLFVQLAAVGLLDHGLSVLALGGEAIDAALWERLRALPGVAVYNCYGPTETTVEAVVAAVREHQQPTIGTGNAGTAGYVLDSALRIVPTGVVGELYLSGAQLTRGYTGRPALTAARFVADPHRPGQRMYRTGDLVRRLAYDRYAYLGRGDAQVKIRGYRVEIGEIEAALRARPGVADAAIAVVRGNTGTALVGFVVWSAGAAGDSAGLRAALADLLPGYMVPARIVALPRLPVNTNGKLDGPALDRAAEEALATGTGGGAGPGTSLPATATERVLCEVFAEQLGAPPGLDDDFFALGLDSIVAISVVHKAQRRGLTVSPRMVVTAPTIRQLAAALDQPTDAAHGVGAADYGDVLPLPIVSWLFEYGGYRRFTNSVLLRLPAEIDASSLGALLQVLLDGHDALRAVLRDTPAGPRLVTREPGVVRAEDLLTRVPTPRFAEPGFAAAVTRCARDANDQIDPGRGSMLRAVWLAGGGDDQTLLLVAHHLVVDVVSWHIMLGDLAEAWHALRSGAVAATLPEFTSYRRWSELLWQRAATTEVTGQQGYWLQQVSAPDPVLGERPLDPRRDTWSRLRVTSSATPVGTTGQLLARLTGDVGMHEFLLATTAMTFAGWRRLRGENPSCGTLITLDGHGRADTVLGTDTSNTVGWFTSAFPVRLAAGSAAVDVERGERDPRAGRLLLDSVRDHLAAIPCDGMDYGLLRYVRGVPELQHGVEPQIMFSYLGRLDLVGATAQPWSPLTEAMDALPIDSEPDLPLRFALYLSVAVRATPAGAQLVTTWLWCDALFTSADIDRLTGLWQRSIAALSAGLTQPETP